MIRLPACCCAHGAPLCAGADPCIQTYTPEELAAELLALMDVHDAQDGTPKYLYGGIHYLLGGGVDGVFWSMVINFLQTEHAVPMSTTVVAQQTVSPKAWAALDAEWTAVLRDAAANSNKVMCMWHHKPSGCHPYAARRCPFVHSRAPPPSISSMKKAVAAAPEEHGLGCSNCGATKTADGSALMRCAQCRNVDAMYCSK